MNSITSDYFCDDIDHELSNCGINTWFQVYK